MHYLAETCRAWRALLHARNGRPEAAEKELARVGPPSGTSWRDAAAETARARVAALRGDAAEVGRAAERARSLASRAVLFERFQAAMSCHPHFWRQVCYLPRAT